MADFIGCTVGAVLIGLTVWFLLIIHGGAVYA
jgi:hypothetical protein